MGVKALYSAIPDNLNAILVFSDGQSNGLLMDVDSVAYVPGWEVFRKLHADPDIFPAYRPGRLKKGAYPMNLCSIAQTAGTRVGTIRMTQHNTVTKARATARALRKAVGALLGRRVRSGSSHELLTGPAGRLVSNPTPLSAADIDPANLAMDSETEG